jgi:hypothetical protein
MNVAVRFDQHSARFGHRALEQTVLSDRPAIVTAVGAIASSGAQRRRIQLGKPAGLLPRDFCV